MHCLGAVSSGSASPQRAGNCGSVLGVVRALGVLVSEGRVQGPPRGYKEGPHCAAPLQPPPNNHVCEKDNYLCDRYVILVREIADRVTTCSYLCVEVLLCTDCPCGLAKATNKDPVLPIPSMSIAPWQQSSEMLLEYWCISVVPSKGPEMMNNQSLYQAVRSRLHFSQVAAWWSRSKGAAPSYITTRVVSFSEDNLRKFQETPSEHTFPLAACGDGNSIKVTVWALPRVEDVPVLNCPMHPTPEKEDEGAARASTPTKNIPVPVVNTNPDTLVLPTLVDDRLQTPCNEPGKHHCRCEEEDGCPPSPSVRANGERKRRRSLPRGPDFIPTAPTHTSAATASVLSPVCELVARGCENRIRLNIGTDCTGTNYNEARYPESGPNYPNGDTDADCRAHQIRSSTLPFFNNEQSLNESVHLDNQTNPNGCENGDTSLDRTLGLQSSVQEQESNVEKRYKCSVEPPSVTNSGKLSSNNKPYSCRRENSPKFNKKDCLIRWDRSGVIAESMPTISGNYQQPASGQLSSFITSSLVGHNSTAGINWTTSTISGKETECGYNKREKVQPHIPVDTLPAIHGKTNFLVNPFGESSPFHESNPGPSTYIYNERPKFQTPFVSSSEHQGARDKPGVTLAWNGGGDEPIEDTLEKKPSVRNNADLIQLMSKLKFPEEMDKAKDEKGILDWISKVPARVFNVATNNGSADYKSATNDNKLDEHNAENLVKSKQNCNLELSQQEFDEVLAVLRTRTPAGRRRTPLRTTKRREKLERQMEECIYEQKSNAKQKTASNYNASDYPTQNIVHRGVIADRLGITKLRSNGHDQNVACSERPESMETLCHKARKDVFPQKFEQPSLIDEGKLGKRITEERNNYCVKLDTQGTKPADCFYNVTNKADVLLGAILRTSKDPRKGLSDISNGARPRTVLSARNCDNGSYDYFREAEKAKLKIGGVRPFEDDGMLPSSLNKRIIQFKQLFKKEQDKKDWEESTSGDYSGDHTAHSDQFLNVSTRPAPCGHTLSQNSSKESRVKRRIDFSNLPESLVANDETHLSTNSVYQNPLYHGINRGTKNSRSVKSKGVISPATYEETIGAGDRYFAPNPIKHSTNLKLQIVPGGTENGCNNHVENYSNYGSSLSHKDDDSTKPNRGIEVNNCLSPAIKEHENYRESENNDASDKGVPSAIEQERFRRSLGNAASMVFHSRTGLPLTSSPAPLRRGSCCFDYDSSLNSVSSKRSALFELNTPPSPGAVSLEEGDREAESTCEGEETSKRRGPSRGLPHSHALLGSFEESALNGRLEPVSTVHGFTAELGASGSFCPKHRKLPVTVFFYTLGDNDKVSTPYLAHINLGKKGYQVPRSGTIQVTLLNPLGTVVKMFVVMYDLSDMPSRSHTFLRQRTLRDKTLRYLIHLRFMSGKSGRIYLHTDIRMIICRKSDVDTASDLGAEPSKELRSFVHGPTNPKFSPRC